MIKLDFRGTNGDGTSGPNAPDPIKFGYYAEEGGKAIWKEGKDREVIQVVEVDDEGTPKGEPKDVKKSPEADKGEYNKYRYNNIEIEYEAINEEDRKEPTSIVEKVVDLKYPIKIKLPARYKSKTIKIPIPTITLGIVGSGGGGKSKNPTKCPDFGSSGGGAKVKTRFGFGIRTVTIANWESDITK
jgi:DnaJ-class molecular chaperone